MAGFREFTAGEPLTATNVDDFLAKQAVMKFADAAARDSALGTAVAGGNALREGMVAYLDDEDEVQFYDGTAWDAISQPIAGIGSNVVQTVKTDTFSSSSTTFAVITGLTATITPTSATSKVLVIAEVTWATPSVRLGFSLFEDGTNLCVPDSPGSREPVMAWHTLNGVTNNDFQFWRDSLTFLASPATTSAVTYDVRGLLDSSGTFYVNRTQNDGDNGANARGISTITCIEVAA